MTQNNRDQIEQLLKSLQLKQDEHLKWTFEERFGAALASFQGEARETILGRLQPHFLKTWEWNTIKEAPPRIFNLCTQLGGLRPTQLLLTTDPEQEILIVGAWWPWGDGNTISIRIIADFPTLGTEEQSEFLQTFKNSFGL